VWRSIVFRSLLPLIAKEKISCVFRSALRWAVCSLIIWKGVWRPPQPFGGHQTQRQLGDNMKRVSIFAIAFLSVSLAQLCAAQAGAPVNTDASSKATQDKKDQKTKAKTTKPPIKPQTGKKTTTSQDSAYALSARKSNPEPATAPPPK
jgi:alpha-beta hydrolase superfamily lysophospholipase